MVEEKQERKLTKEEKEFQVNQINRTLAELNLAKKDREFRLSRVKAHIEKDVPNKELENFIEKEQELLDNGETEDGTKLKEVEKIKIQVEINLAKKQLEEKYPILRANSEQRKYEQELLTIDKQIKDSLELLKKFR